MLDPAELMGTTHETSEALNGLERVSMITSAEVRQRDQRLELDRLTDVVDGLERAIAGLCAALGVRLLDLTGESDQG